MLVGYVRVSTEEQNEELQVHALARAGVHPDNIHVDKGVSGAAAVKPAREMAMRQLRPGMTLVIWRLDRISRSLYDMLGLLRDLEAREIGLRSLSETIDTRGAMGRLMIHIAGAFAQFERDSARDRTVAGIERAKARGVKFGQPTKITPDVKAKIEAALADGRPVSEIADSVSVAESTIRKYWFGEKLQRARKRKSR